MPGRYSVEPSARHTFPMTNLGQQIAMEALSEFEKRRARRAVRSFGLLAVLLGALLAAWSWAALQRPEIAVTCQEQQTTSPECKRTGIYFGVSLMVLGFPILFLPTRWLNRNMRRSNGPPD